MNSVRPTIGAENEFRGREMEEMNETTGRGGKWKRRKKVRIKGDMNEKIGRGGINGIGGW
eukprot:224548-Hanusia_phi.AAC.1